MSTSDDSSARVSEIDERLRAIEAGDANADDDEVARLTSERESLLNDLDDNA